jgi:hypothetical protein
MKEGHLTENEVIEMINFSIKPLEEKLESVFGMMLQINKRLEKQISLLKEGGNNE